MSVLHAKQCPFDARPFWGVVASTYSWSRHACFNRSTVETPLWSHGFADAVLIPARADLIDSVFRRNCRQPLRWDEVLTVLVIVYPIAQVRRSCGGVGQALLGAVPGGDVEVARCNNLPCYPPGSHEPGLRNLDPYSVTRRKQGSVLLNQGFPPALMNPYSRASAQERVTGSPKLT